ncbi:hypothetical protein ACQV2C_12175 [Pantoea allii]|uniref:hypothetical protein n=1 Tax=Pantoea allii TaxID=574096 RepID=UPI003D311EE0
MLPVIFITAILAVMNGAKYQSLSNYLNLTFGYPTREVAFLFSLSNMCGLIFGLLMLSLPSVRTKFSRMHIAVLVLQASAYGISYFYRDVYSAMLVQRVMEGFVFAYIMNFYPVALTRASRPERAELMMCMWGLVYALGFAFSNGLASLHIPDAVAFNAPSLTLFIFLLVFNPRVVRSLQAAGTLTREIKRPSLHLLGKIGLVAVPFFLFTFTYNNFLFTYSTVYRSSNPLYWMMLINAAGIVLSNVLVSSGKISATLYLAALISVLWLQALFSSPHGLTAAASIMLVLGLIEGVIFGFFIRHFASKNFDLVKAGYLVSGSLGATLGPVFTVHFGQAPVLFSFLFPVSIICLLTLSGSSRRGNRITAGEDHV